MRKVTFLSNHKDASFLESYLKLPVEIIPHPYIEPEWNEEQVEERCADVIRKAVEAEILILNGDYFLVAIILRARIMEGKRTGFISMKKYNEPSNRKDSEGRIIHNNILKPIGVRWIV